MTEIDLALGKSVEALSQVQVDKNLADYNYFKI